MFRKQVFVLCLFFNLLPLPLLAQKSLSPNIPDTTSAINGSKPLSQRVVAYDIEAKYNVRTHSLDATETLTYHNLTGQALDTFPFHLYLNGFQPAATWLHEAKRDGSRDEKFEKWDGKQYGAENIKSFEVVGQSDLTSQLHFIQPDDGNKDDRTVVQVHLPKPVAPNAYVQFRITFHDQFPETLERTGWKRDFVLGGQWFPKVGVWWHGAWNCHQFHANTEFFADFGVYDVKLTVPQYEVVGASGVEVGSVNNADGTKTVSYHGEDIHDFAWTVSPHYKVLEDTFAGNMGPVKLRILMQPAHWSQAQRHDQILKNSLDRFELWYGPYPYKTLTLVDPEAGSAAEGMEYPTFITGGTAWWMPPGFYEPEGVVEHEFGHQYWYGMVATNEFEDAWMDEGINSYTEVKVLDSILGEKTSVLNEAGITAGEHSLQSFSYNLAGDLDPLTRKGYDFATSLSYGAVTYGKTASVLLTLESLIGKDTLRKAMQTYFLRYRFKHPSREDFLKTIEEVSGKDLRWYFNQAVFGTQVLDYEVFKVDSIPTDWYKPDFKEKPGQTSYISYVLVQRKGDFIFPINVEIKFDNGEKVREHWDGQDRWTRYSYQRNAKVESVEIDPDHNNMLFHDNFKKSLRAEPYGAPARKLANYWTFFCQYFAQLLTWFFV